MKFVIFIIFWCFILSQVCINAVNVTSNFKYAQSSDSTDSFTQNYSFIESFNPTSVISLTGSFRYNKIKRGVQSKETLTPIASVDVTNDIFRLNLSGTKTETVDTKKSDIWMSNYNANLSSNYKNIIDMRAFYSKSSSKDDGNPKKINNVSNSWGVKLAKDFFKIFNFSYDFKKYINKNKLGNNKNIFTNESFIADLNNVEFDLKGISFKFLSNFSYKRDIDKSNVSENGYIKFPVFVNVTWQPELDEKKFLLEGQSIILDLNNGFIDSIYFYTNGLLSENVSKSVKWNIYWNDKLVQDEDDWEIIEKNVSLPFIFDQTFVKKGFIKLVVSEIGNESVELEEPMIKCFILRKSNGGYAKFENQNRSYRSNFSAEYPFTEHLRTVYSVSYNRNIPDFGGMSETIDHNLSVNFFNTSLTLSQNNKRTEGGNNTKNISIAVSSYKKVLDTLSLSGAFTHSLNEENDEKVSNTDNFALSINASIYPDLTLRWGNSLNLSKTYSNNTITKSYSANIGLTARFTKRITLTSTYKFDKSFGEKDSQNQSFLLNSSMRLSDIVFINGSENITLPDEGVTEIFHNVTVWVAPTKKIQLNFKYSGIRGSGKSDTFSNFVSWKIGSKVSTKFSYNKSFVKGADKWNSMVMLNMSF